ncbi:unnamed protein product [Coffea canephora]|uniref:Uncharacterized protein n=1 Tax=Coffea canephora TaxID=49390 RepID=A0A068V4I5_COFCA|nr:unnamed protein product [Coffea canephora]
MALKEFQLHVVDMLICDKDERRIS